MQLLKTMKLESVIRTVGIVLVTLPISWALTSAITTSAHISLVEAESTNAKDKVVNDLKGKLTLPCLKYVMSTDRSQLEKDSKKEIDEVLGGDVNYAETCRYILK